MGTKNVHELQLRVAAKDDGASDTLKKVADTAKKELGSLDRLKQGLSGSSTLGDIADTLSGAGLLAGVTGIAQVLEQGAKEAGELNRQLREGSISTGEWADRLVGTVPVLGQIWSAGREINKLFDQEARAAEQIKEAAEGVNRSIDAGRSLLRFTNDEHQKTLHTPPGD